LEDILIHLGLSRDDYILAIRPSLKRPTVFLKRSSLEVANIAYNPILLKLFEANIDIQFILEIYGVANYIINYISKTEAGLSKLLRDAAPDIDNNYKKPREKLRQ